jgi:hypothetical protein
MKFIEKIPSNLLIRLIISYVLFLVSFVFYLITKNYGITFILLFVGFVVISSGVWEFIPKDKKMLQRKTTVIPKTETKKTMTDIKSDISQMQEVWDELENDDD